MESSRFSFLVIDAIKSFSLLFVSSVHLFSLDCVNSVRRAELENICSLESPVSRTHRIRKLTLAPSWILVAVTEVITGTDFIHLFILASHLPVCKVLINSGVRHAVASVLVPGETERVSINPSARAYEQKKTSKYQISL